MAPKPESQTVPVYSCDYHWHFTPRKTGFFGPASTPWYKRTKYPECGKYKAGQGGIYIQNSRETFRISCQLQSGFYILRDKNGDVQQCIGENRRFVDRLWKEEDLSTTPWGEDTSIPLPSYSAVNWEAYTTGYDAKRT